ncbi:MAG: OmpA family protein [Planctomycetaceae bacterium]|jgi:chemotaxis protein MotB|nr:OmpA family protein [Planctomycetaceae bacterium]
MSTPFSSKASEKRKTDSSAILTAVSVVIGRVCRRLLLLLLILPVSSCANPVLQGNLSDANRNQERLAAQLQEMTLRAENADRINETLQKHSAQFQQYTEQAKAASQKLTEQITQLNAENSRLKTELAEKEQKVQTYQASMQNKATVTIKPNSSFAAQHLKLNYPELQAREDGDYLRVEFPDSFLLKPGSWQLQEEAEQALRQVINELRLNFPDQEIAVEGHTDDLTASSQHPIHAQEVGMQKALVVYHFLTNEAHVHSKQLVVTSYGANRPVAPNTYEEGRNRNKRVELVVCPQKWNR